MYQSDGGHGERDGEIQGDSAPGRVFAVLAEVTYRLQVIRSAWLRIALCAEPSQFRLSPGERDTVRQTSLAVDPHSNGDCLVDLRHPRMW
jgi:hypothetical protein